MCPAHTKPCFAYHQTSCTDTKQRRKKQQQHNCGTHTKPPKKSFLLVTGDLKGDYPAGNPRLAQHMQNHMNKTLAMPHPPFPHTFEDSEHLLHLPQALDLGGCGAGGVYLRSLHGLYNLCCMTFPYPAFQLAPLHSRISHPLSVAFAEDRAMLSLALQYALP